MTAAGTLWLSSAGMSTLVQQLPGSSEGASCAEHAMQQAHCCALAYMPLEDSLQQQQSAVTHFPQGQSCSSERPPLRRSVHRSTQDRCSTQQTDCSDAVMPAQSKAQRHRGAVQLPHRQGHQVWKPPWWVTKFPWSMQQACLAAVVACGQPAAAEVLQRSAEEPFHWTAPTVVLAVALFFLAGLCEIGGGWLVWQVAQTPQQPTAVIVLGSVTLVTQILHTALSLMLGLKCLMLRVCLTTGQT